jgi:hypothetical protein
VCRRRETGLVVLEEALLARVVVDRAGQRSAQTGQVGAAVGRVDSVGEGKGRLVVAVGILQAASTWVPSISRST